MRKTAIKFKIKQIKHLNKRGKENSKYHIKTPTITFLTLVLSALFRTTFNGVVLHAICILGNIFLLQFISTAFIRKIKNKFRNH